MLRAGAGLSSHTSTERAVEEAATQAMARAGVGRADFVLIFSTVDHLANWQTLTAAVQRAAGTDQVVGSSAAGVLTGEGEIEGSAGLAVMVLASDSIQARPFLFRPLREREGQIGAELGNAARAGAAEESLLVAFPDPYNGRPQRLFEGIAAAAGFVPVVGAGSSENGSQGMTFQLCGDKIANNALSGFALSGAFATSIGITQGCRPVSDPMTITKAEGNLIFEIDNRPAFEIFARVIKGPLLENLQRALAYVFVGLPADTRRNSVGAGEYLVRNIAGLDPQKGILAVGEEVFEGERMIFTLRDGERAREDLGQMLQRQTQSLGGKAPGFGLYFNCCARGRSLYGIDGIDSAYIRQALGDVPLIGMFGSFEIGPLGEKNHLLAYTGVLMLITEKE